MPSIYDDIAVKLYCHLKMKKNTELKVRNLLIVFFTNYQVKSWASKKTQVLHFLIVI